MTPDGRRDPYRAPDTNADGITSLQFPVGPLSPQAIVELEVKVSVNGEETTAKSWFRVWY